MLAFSLPSLLQTRRICLLYLLAVLLSGLLGPVQAAAPSPWEEVETGLDVGMFPVRNVRGEPAETIILRFPS